MKKIVTILLAVALAVGLSGCAGALHDNFNFDKTTGRNYVLTITGVTGTTLNSNISWGGASGTWGLAANGSDKGTSALTVTPGTVTVYLWDYAPSGWAIDQAPAGFGVQMKLSNDKWYFFDYREGSNFALAW